MEIKVKNEAFGKPVIFQGKCVKSKGNETNRELPIFNGQVREKETLRSYGGISQESVGKSELYLLFAWIPVTRNRYTNLFLLWQCHSCHIFTHHITPNFQIRNALPW